ncbi:hypothetical protein NDS46_29115 [Paenibacillus thiaminolyticus]|uniref:hypothetical protein n=1 Tax=Paenibacillus thiaminolyticus TaxID=49283 RepID=UPI00232FE5BB|nr:hypothetical protein [Paenibacillus thiaminolyticus]WCF08266.1 hypothetical protein NDS46_29115 [Paenibacillus thiaminolyticus]
MIRTTEHDLPDRVLAWVAQAVHPQAAQGIVHKEGPRKRLWIREPAAGRAGGGMSACLVRWLRHRVIRPSLATERFPCM